MFVQDCFTVFLRENKNSAQNENKWKDLKSKMEVT